MSHTAQDIRPAPSRREDFDRQNPRARLLAAVPLTERRLRLAGVSTAVLEGGDGPPIVLLHGPGEYAAKWLRVIPDLMRTHRVIAPDLPAHGESEPFDGQPEADRVFAWLDDLIECTCPTRPVLVGQILGGAIAARFASAHGHRISGLVLADSLGLQAFQPSPEFGAALAAFVSDPTEETHDRLWNRCAFDLDALRQQLGDLWDAVRAYNLDRARVPGLQPGRHALMEQYGFLAIPPGELARIAVPTTLIWGRHDLATPLGVADEASRRYGWPLHVIENAADDPPMEQPEAFLNVLRSVLGTGATGAGSAAPERGHSRTDWDRIAPGYDRFVTPSHMELPSEGLRRAGVRAGMRMLDVAAGTGALSIPAARAGARVLATDWSAAMLERLEARARSEGLSIETRVMDGQALDLADDTFDLAGSQFGVMLFPDMPGGLREMARVVKPGGRVLVHALGDPRKIEFLGFFVRALQAVRPEFPGLPTDPPPLPLQLQDPERLRKELAAAGLRDVTVETVVESLEFSTGQALWSWLLSSNPIVGTVLGSLRLSAEETVVVQEALDSMVRERTGGSGAARLTVPVNIGIGVK